MTQHDPSRVGSTEWMARMQLSCVDSEEAVEFRFLAGLYRIRRRRFVAGSRRTRVDFAKLKKVLEEIVVVERSSSPSSFDIQHPTTHSVVFVIQHYPLSRSNPG